MNEPSSSYQSEQPSMFEIQAPCPQCGAMVDWELLQPFQTCSYCRSTLWWPPSKERLAYLVAPNYVDSADSAREVLLYYAALRERSARIGRARSQHRGLFDNDILDIYTSGWGEAGTLPGIPDLQDIMDHLRPRFQVRFMHTLYAPYQLVSTTLAYFTVGRLSGVGKKIFRPTFFLLEEVVPAYDKTWDFRDRGLHLTRHKLRPLTADLLNQYPFLEPQSYRIDIEQLTRPWRHQRALLQPELQPIGFESMAINVHRWWVYRPYVYVYADTPDGARWFLIDGQFRTLAGTPRESEIERFQVGLGSLLGRESLVGPGIRVLSFRCPECGWDVRLDRHAHLQLCENCTRLLSPGENGLRPFPYRVASRVPFDGDLEARHGKRVYIPYWRCTGTVQQGEKTLERLAEWAAALFGTAIPGAIPDRPLVWWIPAFGVWTIRDYDAWSFALGRWLALQGDAVAAEPVPLYQLGARIDSVLRPSVPANWIDELFPHLLAYYLPSQLERRLNPMVLKRLHNVTVKLEQRELVYIPVPLHASAPHMECLATPVGTVNWSPLQRRQFPPELQRTVRRWKRKVQDRM